MQDAETKHESRQVDQTSEALFFVPRSRRFLGAFAKEKAGHNTCQNLQNAPRIPPKRGRRITSFGTTNCLVWGSGFYTSGKRSYVIHYRFAGRSRRFTIGLHGFWTPELARQEARVLFGKIAGGEDPSEQWQLNHKAITIKELCELYHEDLNAGLIMGKGGRPKKPTTILSDIGRIHRHIIPLVGTRRVKDLTKADINKVLKM